VTADPTFTAQVRPAGPSDVEAIWRVHNESIRVLCRERYGPREIAAWIAFRPPEAYRSALASRALFVAERQMQIVGFGQFDPARGEVEACYVSPDAVGCGVGSDLLAHMEERARATGHRTVRLNATLNAETFYERQGYRRLGPATHRVGDDVELDCIRMEKKLP
jgi:GNAT superfamily N-acetyltransferase